MFLSHVQSSRVSGKLFSLHPVRFPSPVHQARWVWAARAPLYLTKTSGVSDRLPELLFLVAPSSPVPWPADSRRPSRPCFSGCLHQRSVPQGESW